MVHLKHTGSALDSLDWDQVFGYWNASFGLQSWGRWAFASFTAARALAVLADAVGSVAIAGESAF